MANMDLGTPVGPPGLRTICDDKDDGTRNWFVTLAYRDLALLTAAYTHGRDVPVEPIDTAALLAAAATPAREAAAAAAARSFKKSLSAARCFVDERRRSANPVTAVKPKAQPLSEDRFFASDERSPDHFVALWAGFDHGPAATLARQAAPIPTNDEPLNANFCTFATWSSLTLGRDIRNERLPRRFDRITAVRLRHAATNLVIEARRANHMELSKLLGLGQRVVLWEVGTGLYSMFLGQDELDALPTVEALKFSAYTGQRNFTDDATNELADVIFGWLANTVRPRGAVGLIQLRSKDLALGLASYHLARRAAMQGDDPMCRKWVAELILRGNLLIGAYEQRKVDQLLKYPIEDFATEYFLEHSGIDGLEQSGAGRWRRRLVLRTRRELTHVPELWSRFFTDQIMVFWAGDELLRLGRDIPIPPGAKTFFPEDLRTIQDDWLRLLLLQFDHSYGNGHGTQSRIWSVFDDRMNFIANFMRSRAQTGGLWQDPFEEAETKQLREHKTPRSAYDRVG